MRQTTLDLNRATPDLRITKSLRTALTVPKLCGAGTVARQPFATLPTARAALPAPRELRFLEFALFYALADHDGHVAAHRVHYRHQTLRRRADEEQQLRIKLFL